MSSFDDITTLFLDLDGTLLGVSDATFEGVYTKLVASYFTDKIEENVFVNALWEGTEAMLKHEDAEKPVLESFFSVFSNLTGMDREMTYDRFDAFYRGDFDQLVTACHQIPEAKQFVETAQNQGYTVVLATNPVFPEIATRKRCQWAKINYDDFLHVTHAENSNFCKPHPQYYHNLLSIVDSQPHQTLMVGNDYLFDMGASQVGIRTWLVNDYQGNSDHKDRFRIDYTGSLADLMRRL